MHLVCGVPVMSDVPATRPATMAVSQDGDLDIFYRLPEIDRLGRRSRVGLVEWGGGSAAGVSPAPLAE